MARRSSSPPRLLLFVGDVILNLLAVHLAGSFYLTRSSGPQAAAGLESLWLLYPVVAICWVVASLIIPVYDPRRSHHARAQLPLVAGAVGLAAGGRHHHRLVGQRVPTGALDGPRLRLAA